MDYKKECQNALDIFEQSFRVFVRQKMLESFGDSWWKTNVPEQIGNACRRENRQRAISALSYIPGLRANLLHQHR